MRRRGLIGLAGGALAWPAGARAQQAPAVGPTIGLLSSQNFPDWMIMAVRKGLGETGYVEGRNLTILYRAAEGQTDRLPAMAAELVNSRVSVLFATGGPLPARAAKAATTTIPIVFAYGGDPVADSLVASISRPEANVTGATFIGASLTAKRLEMMHEFMPRVTEVALLVNPRNTLAKGQVEDATTAAKTLGLRLHVINASSAGEMDEAFATMGRLKVDLAVVSVDPTFGITLRDQIAVLALRYRIPTAGELPELRNVALAGILIYYGPALPDTWQQAGGYVGRILKGAKPSDLPILQPTRFELVINLKTAKRSASRSRAGCWRPPPRSSNRPRRASRAPIKPASAVCARHRSMPANRE
jgi:putative ABC transport system substrate-binding protein